MGAVFSLDFVVVFFLLNFGGDENILLHNNITFLKKREKNMMFVYDVVYRSRSSIYPPGVVDYIILHIEQRLVCVCVCAEYYYINKEIKITFNDYHWATASRC